MVFIFLFLATSPSMVISSCIHVAANGMILFFFMVVQYTHTHTCAHTHTHTMYGYSILICP